MFANNSIAQKTPVVNGFVPYKRLISPESLLKIPEEFTVPSLDFYHKTFEETLAFGEFWEDIVVFNLNLAGFKGFRPRQSFSDRRDYRKYQEDVRVDINGDWFTLDVKARQDPFDYPWRFVGGVEKWKYREYSSLAVILIDCETNEAQVTLADNISRKRWNIEKGTELSYSVNKKYWMSWDVFLKTLLIQ